MNTPDERVETAMTQEHTAIEVTPEPCPFCGGAPSPYEGKFCSSVKCDNGHAIHVYQPSLTEARIVQSNSTCLSEVRERVMENRRVLAALSTAPTTEPQPASPSGLTIDDARAVDRLLRFHETGGHEGDGGDANLSAVRSTLAKMLALAAPATADDARPPAGQTCVDEGLHTEAMALLREAREDTHLIAMQTPSPFNGRPSGERIREAGDLLARLGSAIRAQPKEGE